MAVQSWSNSENAQLGEPSLDQEENQSFLPILLRMVMNCE